MEDAQKLAKVANDARAAPAEGKGHTRAHKGGGSGGGGGGAHWIQFMYISIFCLCLRHCAARPVALGVDQSTCQVQQPAAAQSICQVQQPATLPGERARSGVVQIRTRGDHASDAQGRSHGHTSLARAHVCRDERGWAAGIAQSASCVARHS